MPSEYQSGDSNHAHEAERFLSTDMATSPLIRGIEDPERAVLYWNYICNEGIEGDVREQVKDRMAYLKEREQ